MAAVLKTAGPKGSVSSNLTASTNFNWVYDSGSRRGLEPCSASSILATQTKNGEWAGW